MRSSSSRRRTSKGAVFVEMALIYLVFLILLIGAFDFGQFLFVHQALVERARFAARWGAINDPTNTASVSNMVRFFQSTDPGGGAPSYFNLTSGNVVVTNPGSGTDNYRLNIQISGYSFVTLSPYIAGNLTGPPITVSVPLGMYN
ncbi:MAG TPA: TadE/TadG family type IV pilus assembly protein [Bryobacteraceae bacterium]|nr:TadE/TadG family type IV pilus assembly protein [Bryobacteraceae bacterium]